MECAGNRPTWLQELCRIFSKKKVYSCGLNGVDYSKDGGKNWEWISKEGFHVVRAAKEGKTVFLAGGNGKIAKIVWK